MLLCLDCRAVFEDPHCTTEEDVIEHYAQGGFDRPPAYAFQRVGTYVCPDCGSTNYQGADEAEPEEAHLD